MPDLFKRSIAIILANQAPSGAYIASPNFPTYHYCWFRDSAYIAHGMDLVGEHESAAQFHTWAANTINTRSRIVRIAADKAQRGESLTETDILHTRYTLDGQDGPMETWPNFQLDGFGAWLWSLSEHQRLTRTPLPEAWWKAAHLAADYLKALWCFPCYDCWEEFPDQVHTSTLAAIYGGLKAHERIGSTNHSQTLTDIKQFLMEKAVSDGSIIKAAGRHDVDASLISLATPYQVVSPQDNLMQNTIAVIESRLQNGGVHRYLNDTYYGGGEWVLLTAWLGWYYAKIGERNRASTLLRWVEDQADNDGNLPEQVPTHLLAPDYYQKWEKRWGPIANPLLWSHAMYLILFRSLEAD